MIVMSSSCHIEASYLTTSSGSINLSSRFHFFAFFVFSCNSLSSSIKEVDTVTLFLDLNNPTLHRLGELKAPSELIDVGSHRLLAKLNDSAILSSSESEILSFKRASTSISNVYNPIVSRPFTSVVSKSSSSSSAKKT